MIAPSSLILSPSTPIGVLGAGAMGSGIAHVAALAGPRVLLGDARAEQLAQARASIEKALQRDVEKQRMDAARAAEVLGRITFAAEGAFAEAGVAAYRDCGFVIEAIVEDMGAKVDAFQRLEDVVAGDAVLATNTSSLSIASIASACRRPERVLGVHFFNPATVMPLVEIVPALQTAPPVAAAARALVDAWGKTTVVAMDTPGFIVNRIARPFYGEALRMLEEGVADVATIDWALKEIGGFRMGPFELMDLIGHDVNYAVTRSVFDAFYYDPRYRPSITQKRLVDARFFGRKSGRGFYAYAEGAAAPEPTRDRAVGEEIFQRTLAMLINEAVDAVFLRVASPADIELAMTKGVNYPKGLLRWGSEIGLARVLERLTMMQEEYGEDRYRPSPLLRRMVRDGRDFREPLA